MISRIWKEEKNTVIGLFISVLAGMLLITTIWKNDYTEDIPFGILDEDRSSLSQSIVKQFGINPSLDIVYYADSEQDLKQAILDKKIEAGVMIPENFSRDMSLAASSVLGTMSAGMQLKMLEGNNFYPSAVQTSLGTFSYVDRTLYEPQGDYIRKMSYLLVPAITMQTFLITFFIPLMIRKRKALAAAAPEKRGEELKDGIIRTAVVAGGAVAAQFVVLCVVGLYKNIPLRGEIGLYLFSTVLFMLAAVAFGVMLGSFTKRLACFAQLYMMCSNLIIFTSGLIFPYYLMPKWLSIASRIFSPIANIAVELKAVNLKGIGWDAAWPQLAGTALYTVFWLAAGGAIYAWSIKKERRLAGAAE